MTRRAPVPASPTRSAPALVHASEDGFEKAAKSPTPSVDAAAPLPLRGERDHSAVDDGSAPERPATGHADGQTHGCGALASPLQVWPTGHGAPAVEDDPAGQYHPGAAAHALHMAADERPGVAPTVPTGHGVGTPPTQKLPAGHTAHVSERTRFH